MFILNDLLAKTLSKVIKGKIALIIHFLLIGVIYKLIIDKIALLFHVDIHNNYRFTPIAFIIIVLYVLMPILQFIGTLESSKLYQKPRKIRSDKLEKARF